VPRLLPRPAGRKPDDPAAAVTLTTPAAYAVVLFGVLILLLLAWQAFDIERQRRVAARQEGRAKALIAALTPAAKQAKAAGPHLAAGLGRADDLVRRLRATGSPAAIAAAGELARSLQTAGAPQAIDATGQLARALLSGDRITTLLDRADALVQRVNGLDTPGDVEATRQLVGDVHEIARRMDATLSRSLDVQQQTLALVTQSLAIQRELLVHTRSLDRKLGGELPAAAGR
jgi:hypothetical protein